MDSSQKISPFQLTCLLLCGRLFTVLTYRAELPEAGSALLATVVSPVAQFAVIAAALALLKKLKESGGSGWLHKLLHKSLQLSGLVFFLWAALWSAVSCGSFISASFYDSRHGMLFVALILAAGGFAVFQGLEGIARTAPLVLLLVFGGLVLLGGSAAGSMQLRYLPPLTVTAQGTAMLSLSGGRMNFELTALLFLQPYATKPLRKGAIAAWLGITAVLSLGVMLSVMLCLGYYAKDLTYPVLAVARCGRLAMLERLDPILMGIWVLLALVKTAVFLFLGAQLFRQLFIKGAWAWRQKGAAVAAVLLLTVTLSGCGGAGESIGAKTIVTMLEVERGTDCTVRVEYRLVGNGDGGTEYGMYTADGETLGEAMAALECRESVRLFTESCRVVTIRSDEGMDKNAEVLEELEEYGEIRPLTAIFITDDKLLSRDRDKAVSMGRSLEKLFVKNGGGLGEHYTLKDSIASLRDQRLTLLLPVVAVNDRDDGVWLVDFKKTKKG